MSIIRTLSQQVTLMDSLLQLSLTLIPTLTLTRSGGRTETAKVPRNGTVLLRLPDSAIARKNSTRRSRIRVTIFQTLMIRTPSQRVTPVESRLQHRLIRVPSKAHKLAHNLAQSSGLTETDRDLKNSISLTQLLVSQTLRKNSTLN